MASSSGSGGVLPRGFLQQQKRALQAKLAEFKDEGAVKQVLDAAGARGEPSADFADQAVASNDHEYAVARVNGKHADREATLAALKKFRAGTYGSCEECGGPLGEKRLKAIPTARFCVPCQGRMEVEAGQRPVKARR